MTRPLQMFDPRGERALVGEALDAFAAGLRSSPATSFTGELEIEVGFGKGRHLLASATVHSDRRYLGVEIASEYYRLARDRAARRGLTNLTLVCGDANYLLAAVVPPGCAVAVHVYFPDPWPKTRHHKRRLFDPESVDLVLAPLAVGGVLYFATDHLDYGELVEELLTSHPAVTVERVEAPWPEGPRTNYEAKYMAAGRPIRRLVARRRPGVAIVHPAGVSGLTVAVDPQASSPATLTRSPSANVQFPAEP